MYLDFYQLKKSPFHITPDPEFLFLSPSHKEALGAIIYGIEERKGFVAIIGEVGVGKTTILRAYLERSDPNQLKPIYILNPAITFPELLKTLYQEFDLEWSTDNLLEKVNQLYAVLLTEYQAGRTVVLVIDEAQNTPIETLESLRMLSNLETATDKLLQIILLGQPELEHKLNLHALRQLRQRIAIRAKISPLTPAESMAYIHHRLAKAIMTRSPVFTPGALKRIVKQARGIPRMINILCDNALIAGFGYQQKPVTAKIVEEVIADFEEKKPYPFLRWQLVWGVGLMLAAGVFWFSPYPNLMKKIGETFPVFHQETVLAPPAETLIHTRDQTEEAVSINPPEVTSQKGQENTALAEPNTTLPAKSPSLSETSSSFIQQDPAEKGTRTETTSTQNSEARQPAKSAVGTAEPAPSITKIVKGGDTLIKLIIEVYGFSNNTLIEWVQEHNPQIQNIHRLSIGDKIIFPPAPPLIGQ